MITYSWISQKRVHFPFSDFDKSLYPKEKAHIAIFQKYKFWKVSHIPLAPRKNIHTGEFLKFFTSSIMQNNRICLSQGKCTHIDKFYKKKLTFHFSKKFTFHFPILMNPSIPQKMHILIFSKNINFEKSVISH